MIHLNGVGKRRRSILAGSARRSILAGSARGDDIVPATGHTRSSGSLGHVESSSLESTVLEAVPVVVDCVPAGSLIVESSSNKRLGSMDVVSVTAEAAVLPEGEVGAGSGHCHKGDQGNEEYLHSQINLFKVVLKSLKLPC